MDKLRAALYCHADRLLSPEAAKQELRRQQKLLECYANTHDMELTASYLHVGSTGLDLDDPVLLHMLQDAKRKDFDVILLERFELFPECASEDIPLVCLLAVQENQQVKIGCSEAPLFNEEPKLSSGAAVYLRDGLQENNQDLQFSN